MKDLRLDARDERLLAGEEGRARQLAMEIVVEMAHAVRAPRMLDIESAHIDGCMPFGQVALDLPMLLLDGGGQVAVPTTLNAAGLDLTHPANSGNDPKVAHLGREIAAAYEQLGCQPTWTCAPYQLSERPRFGAHIAWAESNAIVFANSVLGARTGRYGDFFDICAALTGRVPQAGLHVTSNRRARVVFHLRDFTDAQLGSDLLFPLLGIMVGQAAGTQVPAIVGLPPQTSEDQLKALGAAAASSGSVAMFHAVGITPEAATLEAAFQGEPPLRQVEVRPVDLRAVRRRMKGPAASPLTAVAVGTPHFSLRELKRLASLLDGRAVHQDVAMYVSTGRGTYRSAQEIGLAADLDARGITFVLDTCTYVRPIVELGGGAVLTDSGKWAWYAPTTLGADVAIGSLAECVASAVRGRLVLDDDF